jgi:hypothetical protein
MQTPRFNRAIMWVVCRILQRSRLTWSIVWPITHRRMVKLSESTKSFTICREPVFYNIKEIGIRICHGLSSLTIIVIKKACRCHHSKCYMDVVAAHLSIGSSLERKRYSDLTLSKRLKRQFIVSKKTWKPWSHAKRPIQTRGVDHWTSK